MDKLTTALQHCSLLRVLPQNLVKDYYTNGQIFTKAYGKNEILHFEGDVCNQLEVVIKGQIDVERIDVSGKMLTVAIFDIGKNIGANLLFSSHPTYPLTVTSKASSEVLILSKALVFELCNIYPEFLLQFLTILSDHTIVIGTKVKNHVSRTIRESIIAYISHEYHIQNSKTIQLTASKKALTERMGVSRTSLSRELQKMKKDGLIDYNCKTITILDTTIITHIA